MAQTIEELQAEGKILEILDLFPRQGEWTEDDYFKLPETNRIIELSEGRLIITPAPTTQHQIVIANLFLIIGSYVISNNLGITTTSPIDVRLYPGTIRQPDIVFISNENKDRIHKQYMDAPDLAIEVLSESTEEEDRAKKFHEYAKAGITEYWIVDPEKCSVEVYILDNGEYKLLGRWSAGEKAYSRLLSGLEVHIDSIFGTIHRLGNIF